MRYFASSRHFGLNEIESSKCTHTNFHSQYCELGSVHAMKNNLLALDKIAAARDSILGTQALCCYSILGFGPLYIASLILS